jgi:hypothetical protein
VTGRARAGGAHHRDDLLDTGRVTPVVAGSGRRLSDEPEALLRFERADVRTFPGGAVGWTLRAIRD